MLSLRDISPVANLEKLAREPHNWLQKKEKNKIRKLTNFGLIKREALFMDQIATQSFQRP